jgi:hypothetical protein
MRERRRLCAARAAPKLRMGWCRRVTDGTFVHLTGIHNAEYA